MHSKEVASTTFNALAFNRKGDRLITACEDKLARVFAVAGDKDRATALFAPVPHNSERASPPALADEDRTLIAVSGKSQLQRWSLASGTALDAEAITVGPRTLCRVVGSPARPSWAWPSLAELPTRSD